MEILGIQLLGIIFSVILGYFVFMSRKKNELTEWETAFWALVCLSLVLVSSFPKLLDFIVVDVLNVSRTMDFLIITASLTMMAVILYLFVLVKKTHLRMERLVRSIAIEEVSEKFSNKKEIKKRK
jgi:hypothetical protein